ncbi:glycosyltransferase family 2 protein [Cellulosimicrobium cellulans]|uniref:glycosyltransferase family 2 protein n=1 Tax=Cellulosimicrobium cellulans TaxID=1710 RepID=UPI0018840163|nr:glycosyltransferase family 2 protein [Cellulosimicrobium cellulans]MBE9937982.1 glycosyltransferase family 2 protein [Cellulosimicrobium cellulans]
MSGRSGLAIVVVSYGSHALLAANLARTARPDDLVVVVDNRTDDAEREAVRTLATAHDWAVVEPAHNLGFGAGMNLGVALAIELGATEFLLINPDAWMSPSSVAAMHDAVRAEPRAVVVPSIQRPDGSSWSRGTTDLYLRDGTMHPTRTRPPELVLGRDVEEWVSGACIAVGRGLWEEIRGFDPDYFLYWEDVDFSRRARTAGAQFRVLEDVVAVHDEGGTHRDQGRGRAKSATYYRYNVRNRALYANRWLDEEGVRRWRRTSVRAAWAVLLQGGRRQLLTVRPVVAVARGLVEGLLVSRRPSTRGRRFSR